MGCIQPVEKHRKYEQGTFKEIELKLLRLMYNDVAVRSPTEIMSKENFYIFFHINGLWGLEIFKRFDKNNNGGLEFEEFRNGVEELVKGSFRKKVKALFDFYDIGKSGNISHAQLLKMVGMVVTQLYSYPKEQLRQMFKDKKFVESMGHHDKEFMLKDENMNKPILEVEQIYEEENGESYVRRRRNSQNFDDKVDIMAPQPMNQGSTNGGSGFESFTKMQASKLMGRTKDLPPLGIPPRTYQNNGSRNSQASRSPLRSPLRTGSTLVGAELAQTKRKFKISSNISMLVRRYATFLFEEQKLDINKDRLNVEQFSKLIEGHEKIFASYFEGFHNYIWEVEDPNGIPEFISNTSWVQDNCVQIYEKEELEENRFIRFYKNTIFVFKRQSSVIPEEIKNMEGLFVEEHNLDKRHLYGFVIKHRDGVYPEKAYLFKDRQTQSEWMRHLKFFKRISILEKYDFSEKIGTGNFSVVYRGIDRQTNQPVAIKSIEKFKLTVPQREVIQHECGILERCHHPTIVRFVEKSETKTHIYIITELMDEGDLGEYVKQKIFLDEYEASIIMKQLIEAIVYLNSLGLIHRDLKPQNIMIRRRKDKDRDRIEKVKIIDFGFAVYMNALRTLNPREKYVGTPNFVAPEVLEMKEFDQTVDNFSLGVIMYFMLSGNLPFNNVIQEEINRMTIECNLSMDNAHWSNVSDHAKQLLQGLITFKEQRMSLTDALNHPWITEFMDLKALKGRNKRSRYI